MSKHFGPVLCPLCIYTLARAMMDQVLGFESLRDFSSTGSLTLTAVSSGLGPFMDYCKYHPSLSCFRSGCEGAEVDVSLVQNVVIKLGKLRMVFCLILCFLHFMDLLDNYFIVKYLMCMCAYLGCARYTLPFRSLGQSLFFLFF